MQCTSYPFFLYFCFMEIWKEIKDFENYLISNLGQVKSLKTNKILIGGLDRNGYKCVNIRKNKKAFFRPIHRLVAIAFLEINPKKKCVNHKDYNKLNNHVNNLEFCNYYENNTHMKLNNNKFSKYPNVSYCKTRKKFSASIKVNKKSVFLGRYETELEAFYSYKRALIKYNIENKYATI